MNFTQVKETCLYVHSLVKIRDFYHDKLGMPLISYKEGRHVFFRVGSSVLLCFIAKVTREEERLPPHFATGNQHVAFELPKREYETAMAKLEEKGIKIIHEERWPNGRHSFYFLDPEDNVLEIVEPGMWD